MYWEGPSVVLPHDVDTEVAGLTDVIGRDAFLLPHCQSNEVLEQLHTPDTSTHDHISGKFIYHVSCPICIFVNIFEKLHVAPTAWFVSVWCRGQLVWDGWRQRLEGGRGVLGRKSRVQWVSSKGQRPCNLAYPIIGQTLTPTTRLPVVELNCLSDPPS
jgi:hypothetical protein